MIIITLSITTLFLIGLKNLLTKPISKSDGFDISISLRSYQRKIAGYMDNQYKSKDKIISSTPVIKKVQKTSLDNPVKTIQKAPERKTYISANGYFRFKDSGIYVHRWQMEKHLHRKLRPGEVVHHMDGNKRNNEIENLMLFSSQKEHDIYHRECQKRCHNWYAYLPDYDYSRKMAFNNA